MGSKWRRLSFGVVSVFGLAALPAIHASQVALQTAPPSQAPPRERPPAPEQTGTSRISGQVIAADSGAPVKRARVTLMSMTPIMTASAGGGVVGARISEGVSFVVGSDGSTAPSGRGTNQTETDEAGRFEFADLPAGRYSVLVAPQSGFVRPRQPQSVQVGDGEAAALSVRLERAGAITGHVLDEGGEPIARAQVRALRREGAFARVSGAGSFATSDDRGEFRVYDLPPGEYYITASRTSYESTPPTSSRMGYAPTYFPGSAALEGARAVAVRSGQDTPGIDFSLVRARMGRITGTVQDSAGQPFPPRGGVTLHTRGIDGMVSGRSAMVRPDGIFEISGIPPGDYYVSASLTRGEGPDAPREGAYVPVTVNGDDLTIDIRTNTGATIAGRVVVEGTTPPPADAPRMMGVAGPAKLRVSARPAGVGGPSMGPTSTRPAEVGDEGTFELIGVRGSVLITASGGPWLVLKSITRGGDEVIGPMEFKGTERVRDMLIVLTRDVGRIEGAVVNNRGEPQVGATVIVFPDDPSRWFPGSPFVTFARSMPPPPFPVTAPPSVTRAPGSIAPAPRAPGEFRTPPLLPGRYFLVVLDLGNNGGMPSIDRESLTKLRQNATSVTVAAGGKATVQLQVSQ